MAVRTPIRPFFLPPASNNWYQNRRIFKSFYVPNFFQTLCRKFMLSTNMTRVIGTLMSTYVIYDKILENIFRKRSVFQLNFG